MKILYVECNMGVAGDMLMSALYEIIPNKQDFLDKINSIFL
ncbi:MAG: nickel insertion protein, partial [Clostridia bacterium]